MACPCSKRNNILYTVAAGVAAGILHNVLELSGSALRTAGIVSAATYLGLQYYDTSKEDCTCDNKPKIGNGTVDAGHIAAAKVARIKSYARSDRGFYPGVV